jgi:hypothetical protein
MDLITRFASVEQWAAKARSPASSLLPYSDSENSSLPQTIPLIFFSAVGKPFSSGSLNTSSATVR